MIVQECPEDGFLRGGAMLARASSCGFEWKCELCRPLCHIFYSSDSVFLTSCSYYKKCVGEWYNACREVQFQMVVQLQVCLSSSAFFPNCEKICEFARFDVFPYCELSRIFLRSSEWAFGHEIEITISQRHSAHQIRTVRIIKT